MNIGYVFVLIGFILITVVGALVFMGADFSWYINPSTFLLVIAAAFFLCFASFSPREIFLSYTLAFKKPVGIEADDEDKKQYRRELEAGIIYFSTFNKFLILTTFSAILIALIFLLGYMNDKSAIGRGAAVTLLAPFYTVITMILVTTPFRSALKKKLAESIT